MELTNTFTVPQSIDRAWVVITDLERSASCLPGAVLLGTDGEAYAGAVTVKVGPVAAQYEGAARFARRDDVKHHAVLRAEGRDLRGQGTVAATIDLRLRARGDGTEVSAVTDLELTGRVGRLGPGVIADVGGKLVGQFARRFAEEMGREIIAEADVGATSSAAGTEPAQEGARPAARAIDDIVARDLVATGGGAVAATPTRHALPIGLGLLGVLLGWLLGRGRGVRDLITPAEAAR